MLFKLTPASVPALSYGYGPSNVCVCEKDCFQPFSYSSILLLQP